MISCCSFERLSAKDTGGAAENGQDLDHDALGDVRRREKGDGNVVDGQRQHGGAHANVRDHGGLRHHDHLRLTGGAGSEIEDCVIVRAHFDGPFAGFGAEFPEIGQRHGAFRFARQEKNVRESDVLDVSKHQAGEHLRVFDEEGLGVRHRNRSL